MIFYDGGSSIVVLLFSFACRIDFDEYKNYRSTTMYCSHTIQFLCCFPGRYDNSSVGMIIFQFRMAPIELSTGGKWKNEPWYEDFPQSLFCVTCASRTRESTSQRARGKNNSQKTPLESIALAHARFTTSQSWNTFWYGTNGKLTSLGIESSFGGLIHGTCLKEKWCPVSQSFFIAHQLFNHFTTTTTPVSIH